MKIRFLFFYFLIVSSGFAQRDTNYNGLNVSELCRNFVQWQNYQDTQIALYSNFEPLDEKGLSITRLEFMQKLETGSFVCVANPQQPQQYRLFPLESDANPGVGAILSEQGFNGIQQVKKEGTLFPAFEAFDLNGNRISTKTLKGMYVVIKCWYIHCPVCIKEFPQVIALAREYTQLRNDIIFLSFAEDTPQQLNDFLIKKKLEYSIIPNSKDFMNITLGLTAFPMHFIVDKDGKIIKVLTSVQGLEWALKTYLRP